MSRLAMTFERYALVMHLDPCVLHGVGTAECQGMGCNDRRLLSGDINMAVQKMNDALAPYGLSLEDKEIGLTTQNPYIILDENVEMRQFNMSVASGLKVTYEGVDDCTKMAYVDLGIQLGECERFESAELLAPRGKCGPYPCDWVVVKNSAGEDTDRVSTYAYNLSTLGDAGVDFPTEISLIVKTSVPSVVSAVYESPCQCGSAPVCEQCSDTTAGKSCWMQDDDLVRFYPMPCTCNRGRFLGYRFNAIRRGVSDDALDDALTSLINYRQALDQCINCNVEAQARLRRDLGITEKNEDIRTKTAPWSFNNGFGIQTPGALAAWQTVVAKFGIASVVGHA